MPGRYFTDDSKFGTWYVPEGKTPAQALADLNVSAHVKDNPLLVTKPDYTGYITVIPPIDTPPPNGPIDLPVCPGCGGIGGIYPTWGFATQEEIIRWWFDHPDETLEGFIFHGAVRVLGSLQALIDLLNKLRSGGIARPGGTNPTPQTTTAINVSLNIGDSIASVIGDAIGGAATSATQLIKGMIGDITGSIKDLTGGISGWVTDVFNALKGHFKDIADWVAGHAQSIIDWLVTNVGKVIADLAKDLRTIITDIAGVVDKVASTIQEFNDKFIQPIANTVNGIITTISTLTAAIEKDLHDGLKGILQIPSDVAGAMSTLDATMQRTVEQISKDNRKTATDVLWTTDGRNVTQVLDQLYKSSQAGPDHKAIATTYHDMVTLIEHCDPQLLNTVIAKANSIYGEAQSWAKFLLDIVVSVEVGVAALESALKKSIEIGDEKANKQCPLVKLGISQIGEAYRRGFITLEQAHEECLLQGFSIERFNVVRDLGKQLLPSDVLIDMWYRGIITDQDRDQGMLDLAFTGPQISALMRASEHLFSPQTVIQLYRYGRVTKEDVQAILKANRYSDEEIRSTLDAEFRPAQANESLEGISNRVMMGELHIAFDIDDRTVTEVINDVKEHPGIDARPGLERLTEFVRGGISQGLSNRAIEYLWFAEQNTLDLNSWIQLYFRGLRTRTELEHVFNRFRIPSKLWADVIDSRRALIPFRTIPSMLAAGIISETYAKQQLQAHGYDLTQAIALLDYALKRNKTSKSTTAQQLHTVSIATAKDFWLHGALTDEQYSEILKEHGYAADTIALTLKVEKMEASLKERKDNAQAIVDEALAGLTTYDQALVRLSQENYTPAEISKYAKKLIATKRTQAKLPSEGNLHTMLAHEVIDLKTYKEALSSIGYSEFWVNAFAQLRGSSLA